MNPRRKNSSLPQPGRSAYGIATAAVLLLIPLVVLLGGSQVQNFLNFGAGVLSLVSLSCSVIWGLVAQDRIILNTRQRIVAQGIHRVTAVASIAFLLVHIAVKLALDHTQFIAAVIPFSLGVTGSAGLIGLGSLAGLLMIFVGVTGALRNQFASPAPVAARWRAMHMLAYPAWCAALVHGLFAGRPAKTFFMVSYELCLVAVMAALALRAAPRPVKRKVTDKIMAVLGTDTRPGREELEESRARNAETASLAGFDARPASPSPAATAVPPQRTASPASSLYDAPARTMTPESGNGFAAAYRAVSSTPRAQDPLAADETARMNVPLDLQPTQSLPPLDGGSPSGTRWPAPSPPPVGEAPPSAYDPLNDTFVGAAYQGNFQSPYETGETNDPYGTYNTNDTYNSGPANETQPGAFDAPSSGEPWNAPSGGF